MLDIKLIKNKNVVALVVCFCISIIAFNFQNKWLYDEYLKNRDFYTSYELESVLYEIATNSVYTVVGDNASEQMLENKRVTRDIISNHTLAQVYIINNDSKEVYYNNISDFDKYMKNLKADGNYPYVYEINFKHNTMYLLNGNEKTRISTKNFGNIAQERKEDVTTYIAIPYISSIRDIKDTNDKEPLYIRYLQFYKNTRDAYIFIGSKIVGTILLLACLGLYILNNKDKDRKVMVKNILRGTALVILAMVFSLLQSNMYGHSILYPIINTSLLYLIYYIGKIIIRQKNEENIDSKNHIEKLLFKLKYDNRVSYIVIKSLVILMPLLVMQIADIITYNAIHSAQEFIVYTAPLLSIGLYIIVIRIIINKMKKIDQIKNGVSEIKKGNLDYKIEINKDSLFDDMVNDINEIGETINIAVEERLKSERMKNELITNVSHDLKTPLTAMINYISLMKKEDIQPEHIKDYVQVLDKRSQRLKVLIEDLFEASKIGSNNIELNLEPNDINQLLTQTLVEMEEYIDESKLDFILNLPEHEVYILADGKKTFRVLENIISNILKYSLEHTRVYIDLHEKDDKVNISFKNISKHQLNFDPNEITERFTRGDLSRNTEGSGLGLAIAKGFVEAQGGSLAVDIIGDLFIVNIEFNLING